MTRLEDSVMAAEKWEKQGQSLIRNYQFDNFIEALDFVNKVAKIAESVNHHPDVLIHEYNRVKLILTTHHNGGLTEKDYDLAERIDTIKMD